MSRASRDIKNARSTKHKNKGRDIEFLHQLVHQEVRNDRERRTIYFYTPPQMTCQICWRIGLALDFKVDSMSATILQRISISGPLVRHPYKFESSVPQH